jgi:hypothetical protein
MSLSGSLSDIVATDLSHQSEIGQLEGFVVEGLGWSIETHRWQGPFPSGW